MPAGERDAEGRFPADSINGRVEATLKQYAEQIRDFNKPGRQPGSQSGSGTNPEPSS
jgi:hypothetical protein